MSTASVRRNPQRPRHHRLFAAAEGKPERGVQGGVRAVIPLTILKVEIQHRQAVPGPDKSIRTILHVMDVLSYPFFFRDA